MIAKGIAYFILFLAISGATASVIYGICYTPGPAEVSCLNAAHNVADTTGGNFIVGGAFALGLIGVGATIVAVDL